MFIESLSIPWHTGMTRWRRGQDIVSFSMSRGTDHALRQGPIRKSRHASTRDRSSLFGPGCTRNTRAMPWFIKYANEHTRVSRAKAESLMHAATMAHKPGGLACGRSPWGRFQ
ncbi:hypothetical protein PUN4_70026 [Paraburkholderia unamae]|nr:hypothetical protein PUN4_70026 [Paraburkholderia unamae]